MKRNEVHQVDTNASRDPVTQQSTETHALRIYSVQLAPGPTQCPFPVSAPEPKARIPGGSKYIVLPIHENRELKLQTRTKKAFLNFLINPYR